MSFVCAYLHSDVLKQREKRAQLGSTERRIHDLAMANVVLRYRGHSIETNLLRHGMEKATESEMLTLCDDDARTRHHAAREIL